jgi:hypothetical protein
MSDPTLPALWWTFAATLLGSVGTAGALLIATSTLRKQVNDKRREQASLVTVSQDKWITTVTNQSLFPINLWNVQWASVSGGETPGASFSTKLILSAGIDIRHQYFSTSYGDIFPMKVLPEKPVRFYTPRQFPDGENVETPPGLTMIMFLDAHGDSWARLNIGILLDDKQLWKVDFKRRSPGPTIYNRTTVSAYIFAWRSRSKSWLRNR